MSFYPPCLNLLMYYNFYIFFFAQLSITYGLRVLSCIYQLIFNYLTSPINARLPNNTTISVTVTETEVVIFFSLTIAQK